MVTDTKTKTYSRCGNKIVKIVMPDPTHPPFNEDGAIPEDGLRVILEEAKKLAKVNREVSLSEVEDLSILKEAQKELGIAGK